MYHLVCHGVFQVALIFHLVCADLDSKFRIEASSVSFLAALAVDVMTRDVSSQLANIVAQISYHGAYTPDRGLSKTNLMFCVFLYSL